MKPFFKEKIKVILFDKQSIGIAFLLSCLLSPLLFNNEYMGTEDYSATVFGSKNDIVFYTCLFGDLRFSLAFLQWLFSHTWLNDVVSLGPITVAIFKFQIIIAGILLLKALKIELNAFHKIMVLTIFSLYPYFIEWHFYRYGLVLMSFSGVFLWAVLAVLWLHKQGKFITKLWAVIPFVFILSIYQGFLHISIVLMGIFLWMKIYELDDSVLHKKK